MTMQSAFVQHYRRVNTYGGVEAREPHTLVGMLFDGLAEAIANAKGALARGDMAGKGKAVVRGPMPKRPWKLRSPPATSVTRAKPDGSSDRWTRWQAS